MMTNFRKIKSNINSIFYIPLLFKLISLLVFLVMLIFSVNTTWALTAEEANQAGKSFADGLNETISNSAKNPDTANIPQYQGQDVPATEYYKSGASIKDEALLNSLTDPNAQFITGSRNNRPKFNIDKNDPLFQREDEIIDLSNSLANTYSGCVTLPVGADVTKYDKEQCYIQGARGTEEYICNTNLDVTCSNSDAGQPFPYSMDDFVIDGDDDSPYSQLGDKFTFGSYSNNHTGNCKRYSRTIYFYVPNKYAIEQFHFSDIRYDDWLDIWVNFHLIFRGIGPLQGRHLFGTYNCEQGKIWTAESFDAKFMLHHGWNRIEVSNLVHGGGNYQFTIYLRRHIACDEQRTVTTECPEGRSHLVGDRISSKCTSFGWRHIGNVPVYKNCWSWERTYSIPSDPIFTRDEECDAIEAAGCGQVSTSCVVNGDGFCASERLTYECPRIEPAGNVDLCGDVLSCQNGDCAAEYQTSKDATEDFQQAASSLAVADELAKEFDHDTLTVFTGAAKECAKTKFGFSNCCSDSGWGVDLSLASCSQEEKELGVKREQDASHYVGSYCSGKNIFGCYETSYTYCTYASKLARIIVEQGNVLMSRNYGSPKNPDCPGFTVDELNTLDFNAMDLSEYYSDVMDIANSGNIGDPNQLLQDIGDKLQQLGGQ